MERCPLGSTALRVTPLGLGMAAVGRPAYITLDHDAALGDDRSVEAVERRAHEVLDAAWAAGIRYVDAARSYGYAERFLASWLAARGIRPGELTIGSKWGYRYVGGWRVDAEVHEVKDHSAPAFREQLVETRTLLGEHLDLYQVHSATLETGVLADPDVLAELVGLRDRGVAVGLTTTGPRQADVIRAAMEAEVDGESPFSVVQSTWNLLEPSVAPALAEASGAGCGVIVKEAMANGRLAPGEAPSPVEDLAHRLGIGTDAVALAAAMAQPWADVVLSGAATVEHLRANLLATEVALDQDDLGSLAPVAESADAYWAARSTLPWR